jgi:hypothetical protein
VLAIIQPVIALVLPIVTSDRKPWATDSGRHRVITRTHASVATALSAPAVMTTAARQATASSIITRKRHGDSAPASRRRQAARERAQAPISGVDVPLSCPSVCAVDLSSHYFPILTKFGDQQTRDAFEIQHRRDARFISSAPRLPRLAKDSRPRTSIMWKGHNVK